MRRVLLVSILLIALFVTGCGNSNEVVCTQSVSGVKIDMIMSFKEDKLDTMGLKYSMNLEDYSDEQIKQIGEQNLCSSVKNAMKTYVDAFKNCKQNIDNKNLVITADFDIDKLPGSEKGKRDSKEDAKTTTQGNRAKTKATKWRSKKRSIPAPGRRRRLCVVRR